MSSESVNEGILLGMMMITMTATDIATASEAAAATAIAVEHNSLRIYKHRQYIVA